MSAPLEKLWFEDSVATFGDRLEAARMQTGLSQDGLAQRLGVRSTTVSAWERDDWEPRANRVPTLSGMLNVSMVWLMTGEGPGLTPPDAAEDLGHDGTGAALLPDDTLPKVIVQLQRLGQQMQALTHEMHVVEARLQAAMLRADGASPR
jgi:transcriptional regulator with XRE-family HTH domain